jgi:hypothetical protein
MGTPMYLKKKGDPDHIYHGYTEPLFARGDMEPFDPHPVLDALPAEPVKHLAVANGLGYWKVVAGLEVVADHLSKKEAVALAAAKNEE